jgi:hypothetical protein
MKHGRKTAEEERCLDLIERAMHLLRMAPFQTILLFYLGAVPFILAILFFLADMSSSPFADDRCAGAALGTGLLYIWMRTWQALFCRKLAGLLEQNGDAPITPRRFAQMFRFQLIYSSWGLVALPLAALVVIPFGWFYAYFNNLCVVAVFSSSMKDSANKARALSMPWPRQNHLLIAVLLGFGYFALANVVTVLAQLPGLLKSLAGIETVFTQSWYWMGNTTFIGISIGLAYLVVEPLVKAVYVLRFHACESIATGDDLLAELKTLPPRRRVVGMARAGLVAVLLLGTSVSRAAEPATSPGIEPAELDASVERVMKNREFTWRMPRDFAGEEGGKGFFGKFIDSAFQWLETMVKSMGEAMERFFEWLGDRFTASSRRQHKSEGLDPAFFKGLSITLLVVLVAILAIFLVKALLVRRRPPSRLEEAEIATIKVDLEDETIIATMLEEDEWIAMARELAASGELRKAMRAWFLAGLAFLSRKELLAILQSKSNLDYRRELVRRARRCPAVVPVFGENITLFERAWYGLHPASAEDIGQLEQNMERMRHGVEA